MPRLARVDEAGLFHHVTNRGLNRRTLHDSAADGRRFEDLMKEECENGDIEVHAYCLMSNHWHLLIRSIRPRLSQAMQRIESVYVGKFNRARDRTGPLVQGRFYSKPIRSHAHQLATVRYIDRNPEDGGIVCAAGLYPFGSASHYAKPSGPVWLTRSWVEKVVMSRCGKQAYAPSDYPKTFGGHWTPAALRWFERFMRSRSDDTAGLDAVISARPEHIDRWFADCARAGDGGGTRPPVVDGASVVAYLATVRATASAWLVGVSSRRYPGWDLVRIGLLRDLGSESFSEISSREGISAWAIAKRHRIHRSLLTTNDEYRAVLHRSAARVIAACHGEAHDEKRAIGV